MLYHHDSRDYGAAADEAGRHARRRLEELIESGPGKAARLIEHVQSHVPVDRIAPAGAINWITTPDGLQIGLPDGKPTTGFHRNAIRQAAEFAGLPIGFVDDLASIFARDAFKGRWAGDLLAHNFREIVARGADDKGKPLRDKLRLLRGVQNGNGPETRAFLSNSYRRMDTRPLLDAFIGAAVAVGAKPIQGEVTATKTWLRAVIPTIYEPVKNEPMVFGLNWENSDFGNGAYSISGFALRLWCTNKALMENALRQVHLGRRLSEDMEFSQATYESDTRTMALATADIVKGMLAAPKIDTYLAVIKRANEEQLDPNKIPELLKKAGLSKGDADAVVKEFTSADVVNLPPGPTAWRLSNAASFCAQKQEDPEKALELEKVAGKLSGLLKAA